MNTNKHELLFKKEVFQVVGCAMGVLNANSHQSESGIIRENSCPFVVKIESKEVQP